jgi:uncharacterized protein (DUF1684 family)
LNFSIDTARGKTAVLYQWNNGSNADRYDLRYILDKMRKESSSGIYKMFSDSTNDLFLYDNGRYFYNFPVSYIVNTQVLKSHYINK